MSRVWYEPISATARLTIECSGCGKRLVRQRTFTQTASPFNRGADGFQKTRREIRSSVLAEAAAWVPTGRDALCATCRGVE